MFSLLKSFICDYPIVDLAPVAKSGAVDTIGFMQTVHLFAVETEAIRPLAIPDHVTGFDQLYDGLELGVYSALRTFDHNKFLHLAHHIQRTRDSMILLGWADTLAEAQPAPGTARSLYKISAARGTGTL